MIRATTSDSVNLGSNPSSPAIYNVSAIGISAASHPSSLSEKTERTAHIGRTEVGTAALRGSVVYFMRIGKGLKIGYSSNLRQRLKRLATSNFQTIEVVATFPGGRAEETRLHRRLAPSRIQGEFFHFDATVERFLILLEQDGLSAAWDYLDQTDPEKARQRIEEDRRARVERGRIEKASLDAHFAALVAERKRSLGW